MRDSISLNYKPEKSKLHNYDNWDTNQAKGIHVIWIIPYFISFILILSARQEKSLWKHIHRILKWYQATKTWMAISFQIILFYSQYKPIPGSVSYSLIQKVVLNWKKKNGFWYVQTEWIKLKKFNGFWYTENGVTLGAHGMWWGRVVVVTPEDVRKNVKIHF